MNNETTRPVSVLWLEDDLTAFEIAKSKLEAEGFFVDLVPDLPSFKKSLKKNTYDLIIIDIRGETFNGLNVLSSKAIDFGDSKLCVLSGYLDDTEVQAVLEGLDRSVYVLDKSYPFDEDVIQVGLEAQLKRIVHGEEVHTNRTYFDEVNIAEFDPSKGTTTYEQYNQLNPSEKTFIKNTLLELAEEEISKLAKKGYKWFLICGPKGKILQKSKTQKDMSSDEISHYSAAQGFPCVTETRVLRNEEIRPSRCTGMYSYYFSIKVSFSGNNDQTFDLHFDSGSQASWFDLQFLKRCGIGRTGDQNASAFLHTTEGVKRVWYYSETRDIAVYDQEDLETFDFTTLELKGLNEWEKLYFSGVSENPSEELCKKCQRHGRCLARVGVLGHDVIRGPKPLKLVIDGESGKTKLIIGD